MWLIAHRPEKELNEFGIQVATTRTSPPESIWDGYNFCGLVDVLFDFFSFWQMIDKDSLSETTKKAEQEEKERKERIAEKQKKV